MHKSIHKRHIKLKTNIAFNRLYSIFTYFEKIFTYLELKKSLSFLWKGSQMRANYNIFMIDQLKIFKMIISLVTIIILYVLLLGGFSHIVSDVLTVFVLIDLFKTFVDYRVHEEVRITYVTNVTILIVMREIAAGLYAQRYDSQFILGLRPRS